MELKQETISEVGRAIPAITGATYSIITLNEAVAIATLIYVVIQTIILIHKHLHWMCKNK